jgi:hypothetical protein
MKSIVLLDQFIGKIIIDIAEYNEIDAYQLNQTYIRISFDDDSFVCFPRHAGENFWFSNK